jgi:uncharacterized protein (DUF305 family)
MKKLNYGLALLGVLALTFSTVNIAEARHAGKLPHQPQTRYEIIQELPVNQQHEVFYIDDMIKHHKKGIKMSKKMLDKAERQEVKQFAQSMIDTETQEIQRLELWLKQFYKL